MDSASALDAGSDPLAPYRARIMSSLAVAATVFLLPFSINAYMQSRPALATGILCGILILGINALAIYLKKTPPLPLPLLLAPIVVGTAISLKIQGFYGALWCYPSVLLFTFALSRRMANVCSIAVLLTISALVYRFIGLEYAIRFSATLGLTIVLSNIVLFIIRDLHQRLIDQAVVDPLTGAFNRRHMERCLTDAIERHRRTAAPASLLLIDIDRFKRINDQFGHGKGDGVLNDIVALIRKRARKIDLLFRIGGEEFMLLLSDTPETDAAAVAEQLRGAIAGSRLLELAGSRLLERFPVTVSIGVSELQTQDSLGSWMKRADEAMYEAKRTGRDRVVRAGTGESSENQNPMSVF